MTELRTNAMRQLRTGASSLGLPGRLAAGSAIATILLQIAYPLASDPLQRALTIFSVCTFFLSSLSHAFDTRGVRAAVALVVVCVGGGLVAEAVGWRTGLPFGNYRYNDSLGLKIGGVPVVVALAWAMMGWIALLAGRRVGSRVGSGLAPRVVAVAVAGVGALLLVTWDLFLDPQMVDAGHWTWDDTPGPWLHGIPLLNSLGWFVVAFAMVLALHALVPAQPRTGTSDATAWLLLGWTWFSETVGHLVFFGRTSVGIVGGLAMGVVLLVVARPQLLRGRWQV